MINTIEFTGIAAVIFYFTVYAFFGWLIENSYSFLTTRKFFKDGFFWGPFKPMYGFAPIMLVYFISPNTHWLVVLFLCLIIPTLIEYVSGLLLQTFFHRKWWDYSDIPMQLHGHICLSFSICWIFLALFCLKWVHPIVRSIYTQIDSVWIWLSPIIALYFLAELILSFRRHSPAHASYGKQSNLLE